MRNIDKGKIGEALAEEYLKKLGYVFVERNYKVKGSEIDLIFIDPVKVQIKELDAEILAGKVKKELRSNIIKNMKNILVFVEVKTRTNKVFGEPFEAVNSFKQKHLYTGASKFMAEYGISGQSMRFDIVSIIDKDITHIKDIF